MKRFNRFISLLLAFVFLFQIVVQPVSAMEYGRLIDDNIIFSEENTSIKQVFEDLSPEAKSIFIQYMLTEDQQMLDYHLENVGEIDLNLQLEDRNYEYQSMVVNPGQVLQGLNSRLLQIGLNRDVVYALMGAASSMMSSITSLGASTIFSILVAAGCSAVIIANWSTVSGKWNRIVTAFQDSFTTVSRSTISSGFNQAKTSYVDIYTEMTVADYVVKSAPFTNSAARHIELEAIDKIRKGSNYEIYYSPSQRIALIKYTVASGMRADVNRSWSHWTGGDYEEQNYPIGGATLFVLFSFTSRKIFHAHIRLSGSQHIAKDTEIMRRANNLTWRVKPFPMRYDSKYQGTKDKPIFGGNQLSM